MKYLALMILLSGFALQAYADSRPIPNRTFTKAELSAFDGKDGRPAYVAIDGIVYDVTDAKAWKSGSHKGLTAGNDLREQIKRSPHGKRVLQKRPIVGRYVP